jgi:ankyrin repeat protein
MNGLDGLMAAVMEGRLEEVARRLDEDPSLLTASTMLGSQPIHAAHFGGRQDVMSLLLGRGVTLDAFLAAELGMLDRVDAALRADRAFAAAFSATGATALHRSCYWGQKAVAELLLAHGADPNAVTRDSFLQIAPLGCAVASPDVPNPSDPEETVLALAELLLRNGASVNGRRRDGLTALHSAAYRGHARVVGLLLDFGADRSLRGYAGAGPHADQTALDVALATKNEDAARVLIN